MEKVKIISNDGKPFITQKKVIILCETIKNLVEDIGTDQEITLPNIDGKTLEKILEYCKYHVNHNDENKEENEKWDQDYIAVEMEFVFKIITAANYLEIKSLLELGCKYVAKKLEGKTTEEMREILGVENDFTPEEEEKIKKETEWCEVN